MRRSYVGVGVVGRDADAATVAGNQASEGVISWFTHDLRGSGMS